MQENRKEVENMMTTSFSLTGFEIRSVFFALTICRNSGFIQKTKLELYEKEWNRLLKPIKTIHSIHSPSFDLHKSFSLDLSMSSLKNIHSLLKEASRTDKYYFRELITRMEHHLK